MDETDKVPFPNLAVEDTAAEDRVVIKPEVPETTAMRSNRLVRWTVSNRAIS